MKIKAAKRKALASPREPMVKRKTPQTRSLGVLEFNLEDYPDLFPNEFDDILDYIRSYEPPELIQVFQVEDSSSDVILAGRAGSIRRILKEKVFGYLGGRDDYEIWLAGQAVQYETKATARLKSSLKAQYLNQYECTISEDGTKVIGPQYGLKAWFWYEYCEANIVSYMKERDKCTLCQ